MELLALDVTLRSAASYAKEPNLALLLSQYIKSVSSSCSAPGTLNIYPSAVVTLYPNDTPTGLRSEQKERIRAVPSWRHGPGRYDTVLISAAPGVTTLSGFAVDRVRLLFRFRAKDANHDCALVHHYLTLGAAPDYDTNMWVVQRVLQRGTLHAQIIPLSDIHRPIQLIPVYLNQRKIPKSLSYNTCLDHEHFRKFYVNKYSDHHAYEILSDFSVVV